MPPSKPKKTKKTQKSKQINNKFTEILICNEPLGDKQEKGPTNKEGIYTFDCTFVQTKEKIDKNDDGARYLSINKACERQSQINQVSK